MTFDQAILYILKSEGGYVNDPKDPGGETNFGISKRAYPDLDIKALTVEQARAIYCRDYWDACQCEKLPPALRLFVFDTAVNMGKITAIKMLQRVAGVKDDGIIGTVTINRLNTANTAHLLKGLLSARINAYASLPTFGRFGRGWVDRAVDTAFISLGIYA
jgi:lysozyme family protein